LEVAEPVKLPREFYTRSNVLTVARDLLGKLLWFRATTVNACRE
jgi:3-methyladenine DNA glycosylase Mpg